MKTDHLALLILTNIMGNYLTSGHYHIYRGLLSGAGKSMLVTWNGGIREMFNRGYYTEEEMNKDLQWIKDNVKSVG